MSADQNDSENKMHGLQAFIDRPLIVICSSDSEEQKEPPAKPKVDDDDPTALRLIERKTETELERHKRRSSIKKTIEDLKNKHQTNQQQDQVNGRIKLNAQVIRARQLKYQQLKKQFASYKHLPLESLSFVKQSLDQFPHKCQFDKTSNEPNTSLRQLNRQKLTKYILLAIQELKIQKGPKSQDQMSLCKSTNQLQVSYKLASEIQITFYQKLYHNYARKIGDTYDKQIKIVLKELHDKNNLQFRRKVITRTYPLKELVKATEDSLVCQKTKEEELQRQRQIIRQNEKINPYETQQVEEEDFQPPHLKYVPPVLTASPSQKQQKQAARQRLLQNKQEQISKNKLICKKTYQSMAKSIGSMNERIRQLRKKGLKEIQQLKFAMDLQS